MSSLPEKLGHRVGNGYRVLNNIIDHPHETLTQKLSRRDLGDVFLALGTTAAGVEIVGTLFSACAPKNQFDVAPETPDYQKENQKITDPTQKAASVLITYNILFGEVMGHGGLYIDTTSQGKQQLSVVTAYHVATDEGNAELYQPQEMTIEIPDSQQPFKLHHMFTWTNYHDGEITHMSDTTRDDGVVATVLTPERIGNEEFTRLTSEVASGSIRPLIATSFENLKPKTKTTPGTPLVAYMPDTGEFATFEFINYDVSRNSLVCQLTSGRICEGFSGQPILGCLFDNEGNVIGYTNQSYGVLRAAYTDRDWGAQCTTVGNNDGKDLISYVAMPIGSPDYPSKRR